MASTPGTVTVSGGGTTAGGLIARTLNFNNKGDVTLTINIASFGNLSLTGDSVVRFTDTTKPVITVVGSNPATVEYRGTYTDSGATATDNIDGNITASIDVDNPVDPNAINVPPDPDTKIVGVYTVTYNVSDSSGNDADEQTRTVNVLDTTAPVISSITSDQGDGGILKVGDEIHFTLTPSVAEPDAEVSGSYNGVALEWSTEDDGATYTATYAVTEHDADQTSPLQVSDVTMTDEAGNVSAHASGTDILKTIDANTPAAPTSVSAVAGPHINAAEDAAGFSVVVAYGTTLPNGAKAGDTLELLLDGVPFTTPKIIALSASDIAAGSYNFAINTGELGADEAKSLTANITDVAGNEGLESAPLSLTLDISIPAAPSAPDLDVASDNGISNSDNITNDNTPTLSGTAETGSTVKLYDGAIEIGSGTATTEGAWSITSSLLSDGAHAITAQATDAAGNASISSGGLSVTIDTELVALSLTSVAPNPTNISPIAVTAQFAETVNGFDESDIAVTNGTVGNFATVDGDTYTFDVTPTGDGAVTVNIADGVAQDTAGNGNAAATELSRVYDATHPAVTSVTLSDPDALVKAGDTLVITATFNEDMALAPVPTIELTGTNVLTATPMTRVDATHYTYTHTVGSGDGPVTIIIADGVDLAANALTTYTGTDAFTIDNTAPIIEDHLDMNEIANATGGATVPYTNPTATDPHPANPAVSCVLASDSFFPLGVNTVTCTATDDAGNTATPETFTVTVAPDVITNLTVSASPSSLTTADTSTLTVNGRDQYNNITTNQSGTTVVVSTDNGGALDNTVVTLASGVVTADLTKSSAGVVHVTVSSGTLTPGTATVTFTSADSTGPSITSFSPALGATDVSTGAPIFVNFSEVVKASTVHSTNILLHKTSDDSVVSAIVSLVEGGMRANISPSVALEYDTAYYLVVTSGVTDEAGNTLTTTKDSSNTGFTTVADASDVTAPAITNRYPSDGFADVAVTAHPSVTFSEPILSSTVSSASVKLLDDGDVVPSTVSLVEGGTRAILIPDADLDYSKEYEVEVTTDVTDEAGNALASMDSFAFTTESAPVVELAVTGIGAVRTFATADDTFDNGWSWTFHVTVPTAETNFAMKFADFISGANTIPAASNVRYYTAQSSEAEDASEAVVIAGADTYPGNITLDSDLDASTAGRQIEVTVEVKVPVGSAGGSYSASYGVSSEENDD